MSISNVNGYGSTILAQSIANIKNQFTSLQSQLATGEKSTTYSGMGLNEGFAVAARAQMSNISAFTNTITNVNTTINAANTALQSISQMATQTQSATNSGVQTVNSSGQTSAQQTAAAQLSSILGILNTQVGSNYLFSGGATNTPSVADSNAILNGTGTQAGLTQFITQRQQADGALAQPVVTNSSATPTVVSVAGPPSGVKLASVTSTLTGATVTGPTGSPAAYSVNLGTTNPTSGDQISYTFNLPDGTSQTIQLTASSATPLPANSFAIGATPTATAANLGTALTTAMGTIAGTTGRLDVTTDTVNTPTKVSVAEDAAGSPFGLKLGSVSSTLTGATVTGPTGSPAAISVDLGATNPNSGDQISYTFNLPDGTTQTVQLTASSATPTPANSFAIGATPAATAANLNAALTTAIGTVAGTSLVAASSLTASNEFFNWSATATGSAVNNQASTAAPITGATLLSGGTGTDSLSASFAPNDTLTVNGTTIKFVASGATGNELNVTDSVQTLLAKIDSITGTNTPSTVSNGVITINGGTAPDTTGGTAPNLTLSSSNTAALAALGFNAPVNATPAPLRINGSPPSSATSLVAGTQANTVFWYTGDTGPGSARASATARIDQSQTVQYGIRANEPAITSLLATIGAFAATTIAPTSTNANGIVSALNLRVTGALTSQTGQQTIADIQTDLAQAQVTMQDAGARQTQATAVLQNLVSQTETVSSDQVASELLALQNNLQASYQTTSMLSALTLTKYLPVG